MMASIIPAELIALLDAGDGYAIVVDPVTQREIELRERKKLSPPTEPDSEEELRAMLEAANERIDRGEVCELSTEEILVEVRRRAAGSR